MLDYRQANLFRDILSGKGKIRPGITHNYDYMGPHNTKIPRSHNFEDSLDAYRKHAEILNSKLQPGEMGFLGTPEYYFSESEGRRHAPIDRYDAKRSLKELSAQYPNIMFAPSGFYQSEVDNNNTKKKEKFKSQMEDLANLKNFHETDRTAGSTVAKGTPFENLGMAAYYKGFRSLKQPLTRGKIIRGENPTISPKTENQQFLFSQTEKENRPWKKLKNQTDYFMGGEKVGSYKKRSFFNEVPIESFNMYNRGWVPNPPHMNIKPYPTLDANGNVLDTPKTRIAETLAKNAYERLCFDNNFWPKVPSPANNSTFKNYKKLSVFPSDFVATDRPDEANLGLNMNTQGIQQHNPVHNNFTGHNPDDFISNFIQSTTDPNDIIPNTYKHVGTHPTTPDRQPFPPGYNPFFWPASTLEVDPVTDAQNFSRLQLDTTTPFYYGKNVSPTPQDKTWFDKKVDHPLAPYPDVTGIPSHMLLNFQSYQFPTDNDLKPSYENYYNHPSITPDQLTDMRTRLRSTSPPFMNI